MADQTMLEKGKTSSEQEHLEHEGSEKAHHDRFPKHKVQDIAQEILDEHRDEPLPTAKELRTVRWKIDLVLLPLLIWVYALQFLDKVSYGLGSNFGVLKDLQLSVPTPSGGTDLSRFRNGSMIFWTGFIAGIYPLSFLAQRMKPSRSCSLYAVIWGAIFLCAPACTSWQGIFAQRFMLGFFEAGITPCFMVLTAIFYTKAEQASRSAIWFAGTGVSQIIGYPIMYGVLQIPTSVARWKVIYYLWGSCTVFFGILFYFIVPDDQASAYFLNKRQKYVAVERLRKNQAVVENVHFQWYQVREALLDVRCLLMIPLAFLSVIPNACVSTFSPIVLRGLGYDPLDTLLMTIPQGVCNVVVVVGYGFLQQRFRNTRALFYVIAILPVIVCSALLWKLPSSNLSGRLAAVTLFPTFTSAFVTLLSLTVSNVSGHTKRSIANAMFLMGYAIGQVAAPLTYKPTESPRFPSGFKATVICLVLSIVLMLCYTATCWHENRRRDRMGDAARTDRAFQDLTDKENLSFRYEL